MGEIKLIIKYECKYCGDYSQDELEMTQHENKCKYNPKNKDRIDCEMTKITLEKSKYNLNKYLNEEKENLNQDAIKLQKYYINCLEEKLNR